MSTPPDSPITPQSPKSPKKPAGEHINIKVHLPMAGTQPLNLRMHPSDTVHRMKQVIEQASQYRVICSKQQIIHDKRLLDDALTLQDAGVKEGSECWLSMRLQTGQRVAGPRTISRSEAVARSQQPKLVWVKVSSTDQGLPAFLRMFNGLEQTKAKTAISTTTQNKIISTSEKNQRQRTRLRVAKLRDKLAGQGRRSLSLPAVGTAPANGQPASTNYTVLGSAHSLAAVPNNEQPFLHDQLAVTAATPKDNDTQRPTKSDTNNEANGFEDDDDVESWTEVDDSDYVTPAENLAELMAARTNRNELGLCAVADCRRRLRQLHWVAHRCQCGLVHCHEHKQYYQHKCTYKHRQ